MSVITSTSPPLVAENAAGAEPKRSGRRAGPSLQEAGTVDVTVIEYARQPDGCWRTRMRGDSWTLCWSRSLSEVLAETAAYVRAVRSCYSLAAQPVWCEVPWPTWQDSTGCRARLN